MRVFGNASPEVNQADFERIGRIIDPSEIELDPNNAQDLYDYINDEYFPYVTLRERTTDDTVLRMGGASFGPTRALDIGIEPCKFVGVRMRHDASDSWALRMTFKRYPFDGTANGRAANYRVEFVKGCLVQAVKQVRVIRDLSGVDIESFHEPTRVIRKLGYDRPMNGTDCERVANELRAVRRRAQALGRPAARIALRPQIIA